MNELIKFLYKIKKAPYMYFGNNPKYNDLLTLLDGYQMRLLEENDESQNLLMAEFLIEFTAFVCSYYDVKNTVRNGLMVINLYTESDEVAFFRFFELLDLFLEKRPEYKPV